MNSLDDYYDVEYETLFASWQQEKFPILFAPSYIITTILLLLVDRQTTQY